ncbi:MAG: UDP-glucose 4-epimerase GalE [Acidimicrobiaceae bacterium]|nr:UDP-glucose 4-epimerase GalE [Acidimicrobiaceae bacterium]MDE0498682.1 UDP-glucose 4-epimerase GalE [Acidimicrobiaceae bacterium]
MTVLVTGGAGYIGSAVVDALAAHGEDVLVIDNLSRSTRPDFPDGVEFESVDIGDTESLEHFVRRHGIESCIHLAALIAVGESVADPGLYIENNVVQSARLLRVLVRNGVSRLVFSSSAAVYGNASTTPISENESTQPTSPYGWTKLVAEQMLEMHDHADGLRSVSLRYFNAAGATARRMSPHRPATHLIPLAVRAATEPDGRLTVFGDDYPTPDGTAVRDYIHVADLTEAHLLALDYLRTGGSTTAVNLGAGVGHSVFEVVAAVERVLGCRVPCEIGPRRVGDPAELVASTQRARHLLGWDPSRSTLAEIVSSLAAQS